MKIAVILSGCGFQDGAEIIESVSTLVGLSKLGLEYHVFAPEIEFEAKDHLSGQVQGTRNVLSEAARIARGSITNLSALDPASFQGVVFPGGYGAALHLCDWAYKGAECSIHVDIQKIIGEFFNQKKPICAICIAPVLVAKILGDKGITVTIGNDAATATEIEKTGSHHQECPVTDCVCDLKNRIVTTPAYMYGDATPYQVSSGIECALKEFLALIHKVDVPAARSACRE